MAWSLFSKYFYLLHWCLDYLCGDTGVWIFVWRLALLECRGTETRASGVFGRGDSGVQSVCVETPVLTCSRPLYFWVVLLTKPSQDWEKWREAPPWLGQQSFQGLFPHRLSPSPRCPALGVTLGGRK